MMAYYEVAGHVFSVTGDEALFACLRPIRERCYSMLPW